MRKTIIFDGDISSPKQGTVSNKLTSISKFIDNTKKILSLQKKIDDLKNRGTRKQNPTRKRLGILNGYNMLIQTYQKEIEALGGEINNDHNWELESKIKAQLLKDIPGYYPTPKKIVDKMIELADIQDGDIILEPSAGTGNIIDGIIRTGKDTRIIGIEHNYSNFQILDEKYKGTYKISNMNLDFIGYDPSREFDKIIMNPPFSNKQDQQHIIKAFELLSEGGRLVSICSAGVKFRTDYEPLRSLIDIYGEIIDIEEGSFKESGTGVNTVMIVLNK